MYSNGGDGTSILGDAVGANVGATYKGLSVDAYYTKENGAVNADGASRLLHCRRLTYTITNNEAYSVMAKYTMDLGGGFKDEAPAAKLTFFGGYVHIDMANPDHTQTYYVDQHTIGGYQLWRSLRPTTLRSPPTRSFRPRGLALPTRPVLGRFTGAYYHQNQNYLVNGR